ncbi:RdRP-domain-containing protein [Phanerochaete sordida]|uniref:RNA-dependent RNA polymerase n=1 Tax=Phanerochaete sordida TaxID=48140 RepID=A0A9P3G2J5_9APHY|nr:RdRP-domain-containing protein [Phanerochaete sordida]
MEIELKYIPYEASQWDVKRAIGGVLHSDDFFNASDPTARLINFEVILNKHRTVEARNDGTGVLILPDRKVGQTLLRFIRAGTHRVRVGNRKVHMSMSQRKPDHRIKERLEKTLYLNPEIEEELATKLEKLDVGLHVDKLQFGVYYRRPGDNVKQSRLFSNEYEVSYVDKSAGLLQFEYTHKLIRIRLGDPMTEQYAYNVVITFANVRKLATGLDFGNPFICFELHVPPVFQLEKFNRTLTGEEWRDERKYRQRLDSIDEVHASVAPYAHQIRIILHHQSDIEKFSELCEVAELCRPFRTSMEAFSNGFFHPSRIHHLQRVFKEFDWHVAFQLEALLRNGFLNTEDILERFYGLVKQLCVRRPKKAAETLRLFTEAMRSRDPRESPEDIYEKVCSRAEPDDVELSPGHFMCHHVTVTPTRMLLEGPYVIQSNRVIRQYRGYEDHFVRVDFRDEDRLQYRWDRDTDGKSLLEKRVGGILKGGFSLATRHFEYLAYSSSALREHAVWFVNPFYHPEKGWVDAQYIISSLGDFSGVITCPSKYAARIAQAFTATDPSVEIHRDQWEEMDDLGDEPHLFTDGVGTISPELGDMIWEALCSVRDENYRKNIKPSAYQIRFLGYKGMVAVDARLKGVKMRLRPSMNKFEGPAEDTATIEIARAFERPNTCYLNRPLIMVLEDRGVSKQAFLDLQEAAVAAIHMSSDSVLQCRHLFREHSLGGSYRLSYIWQLLNAVGLGMEHEKDKRVVLRDPFFETLVQFAKNDVLRSIKHNARIPVLDSYLLVGVADEGPAYEAEGCENVYKLEKGEIYACVQKSADEEPIWIQGSVTISRSPVVHPGDVQRVIAIGKPPDDGRLCFFRDLKNVVVLPSTGGRSLASMLGGGDLDGDLYSVIPESTLLPTEHQPPAKYEPVGKRELDRPSEVEDICDFIIEYIDSDVLGLLSDRHLMIADQSKEGTRDPRCMKLAELCSQAVDYPKNGVPVDIQDSPRLLIQYKPDWKKAEVNAPRKTDYYESDRALGELYRNVELLATPRAMDPPSKRQPPLSDSISRALRPYVERELGAGGARNAERELAGVAGVFARYAEELRYICVTHALSDSPESRLVEAEVVVGTISAVCTQHRYRNDRTHRMRLHARVLVDGVRRRLYARVGDPADPAAQGQMRYNLKQGWLAWDYGMRNRHMFGASSFAVVALGVIGAALADMGQITLKPEKKEEVPESDGI